MSWYRTYRPQTVAGLHITAVRESLSNMLKSGNIPHALLFAGSKGTGKTSSARIIAKVLNCEKNDSRKEGTQFQEPCNVCSLCIEITNGSSLNVVEMDGASNRRIDDIRQLKERIYMPPAQGKKSVYIIDEVHMLTKEAFNALLKMLEEPPAHVVFIFATTDPQKIPDTIISRCTRVQFLKASDKELASALSNIAKQEKISVDDNSIDLISQSADGSFRDAVKVFEQLVNRAAAEKINFTFDWVSTHLSTLSSEKVRSVVDSILAKDEHAIVQFFQSLQQQQIEASVFHKQILSFLHQELMKCYVQDGKPFARKEIILFLLKQFSSIEIPLLHPFPLLQLELCALEMVLKSKAKGTGEASGVRSQVLGGRESSKQQRDKNFETESRLAGQQVSRITTDLQSSNIAIQVDSEEPLKVPVETQSLIVSEGVASYERTTSLEGNQNKIQDTQIPYRQAPDGRFAVRDDKDDVNSLSSLSTNQPSNQSTDQPNSLHGSIIGQKWQDILKMIGKRNLSLEAILRSAQFVNGEEGRATIKVFYGFHKEQLELDRYRILIDQAIHELLDGHVRFEYVLSTQAKEQASSADSNVSGKQDEALVSAIEDALL